MLKLWFPAVDGMLVILRAPPKKLALTSSNSGCISVIRTLPFRFSRGGRSDHCALLPARSTLISTLASLGPDRGTFSPILRLIGPVTCKFFSTFSCFFANGDANIYSSICGASPCTFPFTINTSCFALTFGISA